MLHNDFHQLALADFAVAQCDAWNHSPAVRIILHNVIYINDSPSHDRETFLFFSITGYRNFGDGRSMFAIGAVDQKLYISTDAGAFMYQTDSSVLTGEPDLVQCTNLGSCLANVCHPTLKL
jgi:hypothetical protein